eukprot:1897602-Rhodomonas_salina.1
MEAKILGGGQLTPKGGSGTATGTPRGARRTVRGSRRCASDQVDGNGEVASGCGAKCRECTCSEFAVHFDFSHSVDITLIGVRPADKLRLRGCAPHLAIKPGTKLQRCKAPQPPPRC